MAERAERRQRVDAGVPRTKPRRTLGPFGGQAQSETVVTANVFQTELQFVNTSFPFGRLADIANMDPQDFTTMTPPRIGLGQGQNTLNTNGVWMGTATTTSTATDPFHRNFWGVKLDHPGWNCCNPRQWNANVTQFAYVKSSPVVLEITLPDPPIGSATPVTIQRPSVFRSAADLAQWEVANMGGPQSDAVPIFNETRPTGVWQYIILPPQKGASIRLTEVVGYTAWQKLLQIGYKPQICRSRTYKCVCQPKGADQAEQNNILSKLSVLFTSVGVIPPVNQLFPGQGTGPGSFNTIHRQQETDWCVQYSAAPAAPFLDNFQAAEAQASTMIQQGFDVLAFGSGIVFQFLQYAPPCLDGTPTAMRQIVPVTLTVHSKTTFRQLKTANQDVGQVSTLPIVGGV